MSDTNKSEIKRADEDSPALPCYVDFNINHYVQVKLTEAGREDLKRQATKFRNTYPMVTSVHYLPKEDDEGWSR